VLSGLLLAASFPPASQQEVAWVGLVPLLFVCRYTLPRSAFK
jgi:apolipoprotein N-acyltransferase